jgi:head-tail adaptor
MPRLRSGNLRQRIDIQSATLRLKIPLGALDYTWSTDATRWCSIQQLSADERKAHDQLEGSNTVKIVLRHYDGLADHKPPQVWYADLWYCVPDRTRWNATT